MTTDDRMDATDEPYSQKYTYLRPGLIVFLVDQSVSMRSGFANQETSKAKLAIQIVNETISRMIDCAGRDSGGRTPGILFVTAWAYSDTTWALIPDGGLPIDISYLADHFGVERDTASATQSPQVSVAHKSPHPRRVWTFAQTSGPGTNLGDALVQATRIVRAWLDGPEIHQHCFPPVVINISDGECEQYSRFPPGGGVGDHTVRQRERPDPLRIAELLGDMQNQQGSVLVFNVCLTDQIAPCVFPDEIVDLDANAVFLFQMSSTTPNTIYERVWRKRNEARGIWRWFQRMPSLRGIPRMLICDSDPAAVVDTVLTALM